MLYSPHKVRRINKCSRWRCQLNSKKHKFTVSDHCDGERFSNAHGIKLKNSLRNILKWKFQHKKTPWPAFIADHVEPRLPSEVKADQVAVSFVNHATLLIQFSELNILTDPVFSKRVSPLSWIGPKRVREPGIALEKLPEIHVVSISHNHYDHLDLASIKKLNKRFKPIFVVPLGNAELLNSAGVENIVELDWWQSVIIRNCTISLTPAQHWSARGLHDRNQTLWGGFVYDFKDLRVFFAGDTGYNSHFKEIFEHFGAMNVSLLPIGAYEPRWFMQDQHMNPEESVQAHLDLHSKTSIGMHFGTFSLTNEGHDVPVQELKESLRRHQLPDQDFQTLRHGETILL